MSIPFSDLYRYIRTLVGDNDLDTRLYEDFTLDAQLGLLSFEHPEWPLEDGEESVFKDLAGTQKARIILHCAKSLISPTPNNHSYRTPILSVARTGGPAEILVDIERRLANVEAGLMVGYDSDLWALLGLGNDRLVVSSGAYIPGIGFSP